MSPSPFTPGVNPNVRRSWESQEEYRARRRGEDAWLKARLRGELIWDSSRGSYRRDSQLERERVLSRRGLR